MENDAKKYTFERIMIRIISGVMCTLGIVKMAWAIRALGNPSGQFFDPKVFFFVGCLQILIGYGLWAFKDFASLGIRLFATWVILAFLVFTKFKLRSLGNSLGASIYFLGFPLFYLLFFNLPSVKQVFAVARPGGPASKGLKGIIENPLKAFFIFNFVFGTAFLLMGPFFQSVRGTNISPDKKQEVIRMQEHSP